MTETTRSRRERPAKPALSREWIISQTIEIVRTEGLEKATMRRVAQALDTGPASLYVYVANTAELRAAVLDELLGSLLADADGPWMTRLQTVLHDYGEVLLAYPGLARSALTLRPTGPNTIALFDRVLGLLLEGGIPADRASWGADILIQHITASAAEHGMPSPGDVDSPVDREAEFGALAHAVRSANPDATPHVAAHADAILGGTPGARQVWAVSALVAGIAATPIPPAAD